MMTCANVKNFSVFTAAKNPFSIGATFTTGLLLGGFTVWAMDRSLISEKKFFQNRQIYLLLTSLVMLTTISKGVLVPLARLVHAKAIILFVALSAGMILGMGIQNHRNKNSDLLIHEFVQSLEEGPGFPNLDLSGRKGFLNRFNVTKLGEKIQERLLNTKPVLKALDLSDTDLTDDNLKEMVETVFFNNIEELFLSGNPRLTGKGISWIAEIENLNRLYLNRNKQILVTHFDEWIKKDGFKNLKILYLEDIDITEDQLEWIIDESPWFRNLESLGLSGNKCLLRLPTNISKLTSLRHHGVSECQILSGGPIYLRWGAIICLACPNLILTKELIDLAIEGKLYGCAKSGTAFLIFEALARSNTREEIYKMFKVVINT